MQQQVISLLTHTFSHLFWKKKEKKRSLVPTLSPFVLNKAAMYSFVGENPTKARGANRFLFKSYRMIATFFFVAGHVSCKGTGVRNFQCPTFQQRLRCSWHSIFGALPATGLSVPWSVELSKPNAPSSTLGAGSSACSCVSKQQQQPAGIPPASNSTIASLAKHILGPVGTSASQF